MRTIRILTKKPMTQNNNTKKDYNDTDMLGALYLGDSKASVYCRDIIRIENTSIRAAFALLIGSGCKGSDVDEFIISLAKQDWRLLQILRDHKTPLSNATQLKNKLAKGFKLALKRPPVKSHFLSAEINKLTTS